MPTGIVKLAVGCFLCKGKGHFRKILFKREECWRCKGKGTIDQYCRL